MSSRSTGRCACGAVRYQVHGPLRDVVNCHCSWCRRTTGHFMAATRAVVADFSLDDDSALRWWNATEDVQYGFCGECGSTLFWRRANDPDVISITAGTLDKPTDLHTVKAIFTKYASDYHRLDEDLESLPLDHDSG